MAPRFGRMTIGKVDQTYSIGFSMQWYNVQWQITQERAQLFILGFGPVTHASVHCVPKRDLKLVWLELYSLARVILKLFGANIGPRVWLDCAMLDFTKYYNWLKRISGHSWMGGFVLCNKTTAKCYWILLKTPIGQECPYRLAIFYLHT